MIGGDCLCLSVRITLSGWIWYVTGSEQGVVEEMELSCIAGLPLLAGGEGITSLTLREGQVMGGERIGAMWTHVRPGSAQCKLLDPDVSLLLRSHWFMWDGAELIDKPWLCSSFS